MKYYITRRLIDVPGVDPHETRYLHIHKDGDISWVGMPYYATRLPFTQAKDLAYVLVEIVGKQCSLKFAPAPSYVLKADNEYYGGHAETDSGDLTTWVKDLKDAIYYSKEDAEKASQAFQTLFGFTPDIEELS